MKLVYVFAASVAVMALGVVQILSPSVLHYSSQSFAHWNAVIAGGLMIVLGAWSAIVRPAPRGLRRTLLAGAPTLGLIALSLYLVVACAALLYGRIGRFHTFWELLLAMGVLELALTIEHSRVSHVAPAERHTRKMREQVHA